ncbi:MAG: urease accessory protein UreD [Planctomycetota bacterium]|jgi:urease accessory protein|nr:urease accessory protein UreD [Planctomycetota bacterium]
MTNRHESDWAAKLELGFIPGKGGTRLQRLAFEGPLRVQRIFHPEPAGQDARLSQPAHCYLLHPPGGLVGGDSLRINAEATPGAHALLTTPSAGKIYRTAPGASPQRQAIALAANGGDIEWLPRETIVFSGARTELSLEIEISGGGRFLGWDVLTFGRPAGKLPFRAGMVLQAFRLERDGKLLFAERLEFHAGDALAKGVFGLADSVTAMSFWAVGAKGDDSAVREAAGRLRDRLAGLPPSDGRTGATCRNGVLSARCLGNETGFAWETARLAWETVRPALLGRKTCPPRIWNL